MQMKPVHDTHGRVIGHEIIRYTPVSRQPQLVTLEAIKTLLQTELATRNHVWDGKLATYTQLAAEQA